MTVSVLTPAVEEPVSLGSMKSYLRVDGTDQDNLILSHISAARQLCERHTGLMLLTQTVAVTLDEWPSVSGATWWSGIKEGAIDTLQPTLSAVPLPVGPVQTLHGIDIISEDDVATIAEPVPAYVTTGLMPLLVLRSGFKWPAVARQKSGIRIRLTVGFGASADVPFALREGIMQLVAHRFDNPASAELPKGIKTLWSSYRRIGA